MIRRRRIVGGGLLAAGAALAGCAPLVPQTVQLRSGWPEGVPRTVELTDVPFFPQVEYQCGPAALATVLAYTGAPVTAESLVPEVYLPGRQGSLQVEMLATARRHGRVAWQLPPRYPALLREVAAGNPVIVLQDVGLVFTQWHYAVINGFDYPSGTLYLRSGTERRREEPFTAFEREWMKGNYWAMAALPADRIAATAMDNENGWLEAVLAMAQSGGPQASAKAYATALKRWPSNLPAAIGLANAQHEGRDDAAAIETLRQARGRHPKSVIVMNNLAQLLSDTGRNEEALSVVDNAATDASSPFAAEVRSTRAAILRRLGRQP